MAAIQDLLQINMGSMNKNDLLKTAKAIQDALRDINERTTSVENNAGGLENILLRLQMVENKQTTATSDIEKLKKENSSLKARIRQLEKSADESYEETEERFIELETAVTKCEQYTRRENIEISGISADVSDDDLETKVLTIVNAVTERTANPILAKDIHACHLLKKRSPPTTYPVEIRHTDFDGFQRILNRFRRISTDFDGFQRISQILDFDGFLTDS